MGAAPEASAPVFAPAPPPVVCLQELKGEDAETVVAVAPSASHNHRPLRQAISGADQKPQNSRHRRGAFARSCDRYDCLHRWCGGLCPLHQEEHRGPSCSQQEARQTGHTESISHPECYRNTLPQQRLHGVLQRSGVEVSGAYLRWFLLRSKMDGGAVFRRVLSPQ